MFWQFGCYVIGYLKTKKIKWIEMLKDRQTERSSFPIVAAPVHILSSISAFLVNYKLGDLVTGAQHHRYIGPYLLHRNLVK